MEFNLQGLRCGIKIAKHKCDDLKLYYVAFCFAGGDCDGVDCFVWTFPCNLNNSPSQHNPFGKIRRTM
jgi:hypothetical protein